MTSSGGLSYPMDMQPIHIDANYYVSPQISVDDVSALAAAGFAKIICNRPDEEVPQELRTEGIRIAAESAGIDFEVLPLTHQTMHAENIKAQFEIVAGTSGPVVAYCASGTRCTVVWALSQVGKKSADDILKTTEKAGYNLEGLRPHLI